MEYTSRVPFRHISGLRDTAQEGNSQDREILLGNRSSVTSGFGHGILRPSYLNGSGNPDRIDSKEPTFRMLDQVAFPEIIKALVSWV